MPQLRTRNAQGYHNQIPAPLSGLVSRRQAPSKLDELKVPDAKKTADISRGVRFVGSVWNWYINYHPSWYCHDCGLLLIDTQVELER